MIDQSESVNYAEQASLLQDELETVVEKYNTLLYTSLNESE
jgi:hypothetical protein